MSIDYKKLTIGDRVKQLREDRSINEGKEFWSLEALAAKANTSAQSLSKLERNLTTNPSMDLIKNLSIIFGVSCDYLIFGEDHHQLLTVEIICDKNFYNNIQTKIKSKKNSRI